MALTMDRGEDRTIQTVLRDGAQFSPGDVVWFTLKRRHSDSDDDAILQLVSSDGGVNLSGGTASAQIPSAATAGLTATTILVFDWQARSASGQIITLDKGSLIVTPDVTQSTVVP